MNRDKTADNYAMVEEESCERFTDVVAQWSRRGHKPEL